MKPGDYVGKYQILGKLAMGGMAAVYLARQEGPAGFQKIAVLKVILPHLVEDTKFVDMFLNEARLAAKINHPNAVQIFELGGVDEEPWLAMEYIDGKNLTKISKGLKEKGELLPHPILLRIAADACAGLDTAHNLKDQSGKPMDLVHRDVSPENILVAFSGQVKVVDFGIAKASTDGGLTRTGQIKGKIAYMSPEQVKGEPVDRRTDVFALGVCLYQAIAGVRPFEGLSDFKLIEQIVYDPHPPLAGVAEVPADLAAIVDKCLSKPREERFPSARALQGELERCLAKMGGATTYDVSEFLEAKFPATTDKERVRVSRILSGEAISEPSGNVAKTPISTVSQIGTPKPGRSLSAPTSAPRAREAAAAPAPAAKVREAPAPAARVRQAAPPPAPVEVEPDPAPEPTPSSEEATFLAVMTPDGPVLASSLQAAKKSLGEELFAEEPEPESGTPPEDHLPSDGATMLIPARAPATPAKRRAPTPPVEVEEQPEPAQEPDAEDQQEYAGDQQEYAGDQQEYAEPPAAPPGRRGFPVLPTVALGVVVLAIAGLLAYRSLFATAAAPPAVPVAGQPPRGEAPEPARPEQPAAGPDTLAGKPEEPGAKPEEPGAKPEEPGAKPEEPGAKPEDPAAGPAALAVKAPEPAAKPAEPAAKPAEPAAKPADPAAAAAAAAAAVKPGAQKSPEARAAPKEAEATLTVKSNPAAELYIAGKRKGKGESVEVKLPPGSYAFEVRGDGWKVARTVKLAAGESRVETAAPGRGKLEIKVSPWAKVTLDGVDLGPTPLRPQDVNEGKHRLVLVNPDLKKEQKLEVVVVAGETKVLKIRLDE